MLHRKRVNDGSFTTALLATAFAKPNTLYSDLLPYSPKRQLDPETIVVVSKLFKAGKMPRKVVSILGSVGLLQDLSNK
jgi:hypothetical protein